MIVYTDTPENRTRVVLLLQAVVLPLTFVKANGDQRTMLATRIPAKLPPTTSPLATAEELAAGASCPVLDVEANEWRSFRWDSLREIGQRSEGE